MQNGKQTKLVSHSNPYFYAIFPAVSEQMTPILILYIHQWQRQHPYLLP